MPVPRRSRALAPTRATTSASLRAGGLLLALALGVGLPGPAGAVPADSADPVRSAVSPAPADPSGDPSSDSAVDSPLDFAGPADSGELDAAAALRRAEALVAGPAIGPGRGVDGSQVQRDLYRLAPQLPAADRVRARALLARPTDGRRDRFGDGYRTAARRTCGPQICVHWVPRTVDAPPDRAWVRRTLRVMERVWRAEVGRLGFRAPLPDGRRGGDDRFDVYLRDLGSIGAYGYCTPERAGSGADRRTSAGYCVLDNDFDPAQYAGAAAGRSLRVTAAHEFFHAVQLAYDAAPDPWFSESTAVWMESQVFPGAGDNRQYLPFGQLAAPRRPLDRFEPTGFAHYGNWVFWQRLSERFGPGVVRRTWERSARGAYSSRALRDVLAGRGGGLPAVLAEYGGALADPTRTFRDAAAWPVGDPPPETVLSTATPSVELRQRLDHLTTDSHRFVPDPATLSERGTRLAVRVRGPVNAATGPGAWVRVVRTDGRVRSRAVTLDRRGRGQAVVAFAAGRVESVTVTLANASVRFVCQRRTTLSCQGRPRDDDRRFRLTASVR